MVRVNLSDLIYLNLVICVQKLYPKLKVSETSRTPINLFQAASRGKLIDEGPRHETLRTVSNVAILMIRT